jgi:hypothetical protein
MIPDAELGYRMSPYYPGNDAWGFRNEKVPEGCEWLAVGDSTTYGFAAPPEKSWPRQLAALGGVPGYNMSCAGYGPCEYLVLLKRGLALNPKTVFVGITMDNDFLDSFWAVYRKNLFDAFRNPDERVVQSLSFESRGQLASALYGPADQTTSCKQWLSERCSLWGLAREWKEVLVRTDYRPLRDDPSPQDTFEVAAGRSSRWKFDRSPAFRTVFYDPEVYATLIRRDPCLEEGRRITEAVLLEMQAILAAHGVRFVVVIFPTKEVAYRDLLFSPSDKEPSPWRPVLEREEQLQADLVRFLEAHAIECVDTTAALRLNFDKGIRPYPESDDLHPNSAGYQSIAETVLPHLCADRKLPHRVGG